MGALAGRQQEVQQLVVPKVAIQSTLAVVTIVSLTLATFASQAIEYAMSSHLPSVFVRCISLIASSSSTKTFTRFVGQRVVLLELPLDVAAVQLIEAEPSTVMVAGSQERVK